MAISLDQATKRILIPKADTTLVSSSPDIRSIDINFLHNELRTLEATESNDVYERTHDHVTPFDLGVFVLGRVIKILDPWTVEFVSTGTPYEVQILGGNSNITAKRVVNDVSLTPNNSAGNTLVISGSGVTQQDKDDIENQIFTRVTEGTETFEMTIRILRAVAAGTVIEEPNGDYKIMSMDGTTERITGIAGANSGRQITGVDGT